jgi:hypothetical protein
MRSVLPMGETICSCNDVPAQITLLSARLTPIDIGQSAGFQGGENNRQAATTRRES